MADLGKRQATMDLALSLLPANPVIVETGCAREPGNWLGDGLSTVVFGEHCREHGGSVWSVDNDREHLDAAQAMAEGLPVAFALRHSVLFLEEFSRPIDLLYLDSLDYPYGPLCDLYGGKVNLDGAIATLRAMSEEEIVEKHRRLILPSQIHCGAEVLAALPHRPALVLIDDADLPGGGKARIARLVLAEAGYRCVADAYQTLWQR